MLTALLVNHCFANHPHTSSCEISTVEDFEKVLNSKRFRDLKKGVENFLLIQKSDQVLEQAAQGGGGVTVPGGVQETFGCCTKGRGLVGNIGGR